MSELLHAASLLTTILKGDPVQALAMTAAWLDPLPLTDWDEDDDDEFAFCLAICRRCFPDVYAESICYLRSETPRSQIERVFCNGIGHYLVAGVQDIDQLRGGVPWEALGIRLFDQDALQDMSPRLRIIAGWLGATGEDDLEEARSTAEALIKSLEPYGEAGIHRDLACLLGWSFGMSGNTLVDHSDEDLYDAGIEAVPWEPEDVAFINEVQQEAYEMVEAAERALCLLETNADWRDTFQRHVDWLRRNPTHAARLDWPAPAGDGHPDTANTDP